MEKDGLIVTFSALSLVHIKTFISPVSWKRKNYFIETFSKELLMQKLKLCDDLLHIMGLLDPQNIRLSTYIAVVLYEKINSIVEMHRRQLEKSHALERESSV